MLRPFTFAAIGCVGLLFTAGCARPQNDKPDNTLHIALPKNLGALASQKLSALSTPNLNNAKLSHVAINATGSGINSPLVLSWDSCHGCSTESAAPTSFEMLIPSGSGRLIQVLAVYQDPQSGQLFFYYGDVSTELNGGEVTLNVPISQLSQNIITQGQVSGRYYTTATDGPTGTVDIKFVPGGSKPNMIVDQSSIVNGWFSFFMLSGAPLQYVVRETGDVLWGGPVSAESSALDPSANLGANFDQRLKVYIPVHTHRKFENSTAQFYAEDVRTYAWGYWGPGAVGKKVCTVGLGSSPVLQNLKQYVTANYAAAPNLTVTRLSSYSLVPPTYAQLIDTTTVYSSVVVQGGGPSDMSTNCASFSDTPAYQFSSFQKVGISNIDAQGNDNVAGFSGIFRTSAAGQSINITSDPKTLTGVVLPGVELVADSLRLYKVLNFANQNINAPVCSDLAGGSQGFILGSVSDATINPGNGNFSLNSNISLTDAANNVAAVICPVRAGKVASWGGYFMSSSYFGGNFGVKQATKLALVPPQGYGGPIVANNTCTPVRLRGLDDLNIPAPFPQNTNFSFASGDATIGVYTDPNCAYPFANSYYGGNEFLFFIKRSTGPAASTNFTLSASASGLASDSAALKYVDPPGTPTPAIKMRGPLNINAFSCNALNLESWTDDGSLAMVYDFGAAYRTATLPSISGLTFYSDPQCVNPVANATLGYGATNASIFYRYTLSLSSLNLAPASVAPSTPVSGPTTVTVNQPGPAVRLQFSMPFATEANYCQGLSLNLSDSSGLISPTAAGVNINLSATAGGQFFSDPGCGTVIPTIAFNSGDFKKDFYFSAGAVGDLTLSAADGALSLATSSTLTIKPETFTTMLIATPGKTFTSGFPLGGSATTLNNGIAFTVDIYLVRSDYTKDPNANGPLLNNLNFSGASNFPPAASVNFVNGHASFTVVPVTGTFSMNASAQGSHGPVNAAVSPPVTVAP